MKVKLANDIIYIEDYKGNTIVTIKGKIVWLNECEIEVADIDNDNWIRLQLIKKTIDK